jgi:hypothetical protein
LEVRDCSRMKQRGDKFGYFFVFHALTISKKGGEPPNAGNCYQHGWGLHIYAPSFDFVRLSNYLEG